MQYDDRMVVFDDAEQRNFNAAAENLARQGMRVLAFAYEFLLLTESVDFFFVLNRKRR